MTCEADSDCDYEFVEDDHRRFGRAPQSPHDVHRPLLPDEPLDDIFRLQVERKVRKNLTLNYERVLYVLEPTAEADESASGEVTSGLLGQRPSRRPS